jgi:hypothetical protein
MYVLLLTFFLPVTASDQFSDLVDKALEEKKDTFNYDGLIWKVVQVGRKAQVFAIGPEQRPPEPHTSASPTALSETLESSGLAEEMGGLWSSDEEESEEAKGQRLVSIICANRNSQKCAALRRRHNLPADPTPETDSDGSTIATTKRPPLSLIPDPCQGNKACYTWGNFRETVFLPLVKQMEQNGKLGKLPGDKADGALFNPRHFREWREAVEIPKENQAIAAGTAAAMSLKLLTAVLSQLRLTRVDVEDLDSEIPWTTWLSIPGLLLLLVYLCVSIHQIKTYWRRRLLQTEEQKATRMFDHFLKLQQDKQSYSRDGQRASGGPQDVEEGIRYRDPRISATMAQLVNRNV